MHVTARVWVFAAFLAVGCGSTPGRVEVIHDDFRGGTVVQVTGMAVAGGPTGGALVSVYGSPGGAEVEWAFRVDPENWAYLECHSLDFLADGHPVPHGESEHAGSVRYGGVSETVSTSMTAGDFAALARCTDVRARVCNDVYRFTPDELRTFRAFAARVGR